MKANLMFKAGYTGRMPELSFASSDLLSDLELGRILAHMANGDKAIFDACEEVLLSPLQTEDAIKYRQEILADTLRVPDAVRRLYAIAAETDNIKKYYLSPTRQMESFMVAVEFLKVYTKLLRDLREVADRRLQDFKSEGFRSFLEMLQRELPDDFFNSAREQIAELSNMDNILISARLGKSLQSIDYTLRRKEKGFWLHWTMSPSFTADPQRGPEELQDLYNRQARAISQATSALTHSTTFIEGFFSLLRKELAFYVGCLNLTEHMRRLGVPFCIPTILPMESRDRSWHNMYDLSLALTKNNNQVVGNDLDAVNKRLYIITGANQGGKSTFLRSLGQSQLMAQCGMPAPATSISFPIRRNLLTHFKKEEDRFMKSGKLDEELTRMNRLADHIERYSMVLFNESFASTNEREGSEICQQITQALTDNDVEVFSVTHLFMFATKYIGNSEAQFLMAERREDSQRTFKIIPGEPLETAFGEDLYQKIFVQAGMTLS